ncbi:LOW QUALITY PROTEIN: cytochrome P450 6k1-like [Schistocerca cancellata]|uniref:LOW QUALITY PROTEIN: cytochrome P450 6k1-like n=1 Tax=Schistocerca cancellata TaxID=274614 RepID=UPI0021195A45|nr:LOW QUALITY PROTEIN: cytochrome P450 6k1-like [Schistocerca cancellata]
MQNIYNHLPKERYVGFYGFHRPLLLIRDPELIRHVHIKDFGTFHDRGLFIDDEEPLNKHLFFLAGKKWRQLRIKLSPTFTSGKLKGMFKQSTTASPYTAHKRLWMFATVSFSAHKNSITARCLSQLSVEDMAAQAFVFFAAGFETSSTATSFTLHELALNPDIQSKLHDEIDAVLEENGESLRKHPPAAVLNRECNQDYKIPDSDIVLEKRTPVVLSVLGLHHDPTHFPHTDRFDPERFSEEAKAKRHPYVYLPFGEGPRICIGMRMGLLQTKVGLTNILSKYSVRTTQKTVANLVYHPRSPVLMAKSGIHLQFVRRF